MIIDFQKERNKTRYACPECKKKGEYCPEWVIGIPGDGEKFMKLSVDDKLEWLYHTRHLRIFYPV